MKEKIISKRYGDAFIAYAKNTKSATHTIKEIKKIKQILGDNPQVIDFLANPQLGYADKCSFIERVFGGLSEDTMTLFKLLLEKGRIINAAEIIDYIAANYYSDEIQDVLLETARPLEAEQLDRIKEKLEHKLKRKLRLVAELDRSLLGGAKTTIGNIIIDGSVRRRLDDLKEELMAVKVS
jgi:F-type H+-transporting ATPase subunit delta